MEPSGLSQHTQPGQPAAGELVVLNGRQSGTRRELDGPLTIIGRAQSCEVRLNVEGVDPFHCVLAAGPDDVTVRDLGSAHGTFVNGQRISAALLRDGDLLDVGPFRFRVLLPAVAPAPRHAEGRDALRIQAAAVAAQQAALDEEEVRLVRRRMTLEQQEAQLAAHLDEQRQQLLDAAQRQHAERLALTRDLAAQEQQIEERSSDLNLARIVLERDREENLAALQRAHNDARTQLEREQAELRERSAAEEQRLAERAAAMDRVRDELQDQHAQLALQQVRFNTERELDSRLLQDGWHCLEQDQKRWRERRDREAVALRVRRLGLVEGERKLAKVRSLLLVEKQEWEAAQHTLQGELCGLNTRVLHQRLKLQEQATNPLSSKPPEPEQSAEQTITKPTVLRAADLARVAAQLADQRVELVEQWERLARVEQTWQERRDEAINELEMLAERLARDESDLARREVEIQSCERQLQKRQEHLDQLRRDATAAHRRAEVHQQAWESEREHILAEAGRVHEVARYQLDLLGELRRKWNRRRQQETEALRADRRAVERLRQELADGRQELLRQAQMVDDERRTLLERAMALHEHRQEAHTPAGAGKGEAEQLRRRWLTQNAAVLRALKLQRAGLKKELDRVGQSQADLAEQTDRLAQAQAVCREQEISLEQREAALAATQAHLDQQQKRSDGRTQHTERRLALLQEETDHLARALIPDSDGPLPLERAA